jgi:MFS family permease
MTTKKDYLRLAVFMFLVTSSFGFLQPFVPLYMEAAGFDRSEIGMLSGVGVGIALLLQPILGRLSDHFDTRRPFICVAGLTAFVAYIDFPYAATYGRFLVLITLGNAGLMYLNAAGGVLIGRLSQASKGGALYGGLRLWGSVGYIMTSCLSGILVWKYGGETLTKVAIDPVFKLGPFLFLILAAIAWVLPDERKPSMANGASGRQGTAKAPLPANLIWFFVAYFLYNFALYGASNFLSIFMKSLGAKPLAITGTFAAGVLVEVFVMRWSGRFSDRFGRRPTMAISFMLLPARLLLYIPATGPLWVLAVQMLHGVNFGIMGAIAVVFINDLTSDSTRGQAQARLFAVTGIATALSPIVFGRIAKVASLPMMFAAASGIALLGAVVFLLRVEDSHHGSESLSERLPAHLRRFFRWLDTPRFASKSA